MATGTTENSTTVSSERIELFVKLLGTHQQQVHRYVLCLVPSAHDADDILQETNLFLWREFHKFEEGTSFTAWACAVAFHKVLAWRKQRSRDKLVYCDQFLEAVHRELINGIDRQDERASALQKCMERLPQRQRDVLHLRYGCSQRVDEIAQLQNSTSDAIYRLLSRVRQGLLNCVNNALAAEGAH